MINRTTMIAITRGSISRKGSRSPRGERGDTKKKEQTKMRENRCRGLNHPGDPALSFLFTLWRFYRVCVPFSTCSIILGISSFHRTTMRTTDVESIYKFGFSTSPNEIVGRLYRPRTPTWTSCWFRKIRNTGSIRGRADIEIT